MARGEHSLNVGERTTGRAQCDERMVDEIRCLFRRAVRIGIGTGGDELRRFLSKLLQPEIAIIQQAARIAGGRCSQRRALRDDRVQDAQRIGTQRDGAEAGR